MYIEREKLICEQQTRGDKKRRPTDVDPQSLRYIDVRRTSRTAGLPLSSLGSTPKERICSSLVDKHEPENINSIQLQKRDYSIRKLVVKDLYHVLTDSCFNTYIV